MAVLKVIVLLILGVAKDLGKRNTFILFAVLIVVDLLAVFFYVRYDGIALAVLASTVTRLLMDATIGLSICGKYADKAARGTK